jgi:uncharacterized membrane protein
MEKVVGDLGSVGRRGFGLLGEGLMAAILLIVIIVIALIAGTLVALQTVAFAAVTAVALGATALGGRKLGHRILDTILSPPATAAPRVVIEVLKNRVSLGGDTTAAANPYLSGETG